MSDKAPPRWMERVLLHFLPARDRETISGDLLEEYREAQAPRRGVLGANLWYLWQALSLIPYRDLLTPPLTRLLMGMAGFTAAAGVWLAVMENVLKHAGYAERTAIAATIVIQGVATLLFPVLDSRAIYRVLVSAGAIALAVLGAFAIRRILVAAHFEGYVLLIGFALVAQGVLTLLVMLGSRRQQAR